MCFTNRFLGTREICYSDCLLTLGLINGNQAFWRIPSSLAFPFPCSLGRNQGFESSNTTASSFHLVVNILLFLYPPMLFKGIHFKYELLCSGRKSPNSIQTRLFRNAARYNSRLCSSFPHSFSLQTWCLPAGDLCSDPKSPAAAIPPPIHTRPVPLSLLSAFPLLFPPSIQFSP